MGGRSGWHPSCLLVETMRCTLRASLAILALVAAPIAVAPGCVGGPQPEPPTFGVDAGQGQQGDGGPIPGADAGAAADGGGVWDSGHPRPDAGADAGPRQGPTDPPRPLPPERLPPGGGPLPGPGVLGPAEDAGP